MHLDGDDDGADDLHAHLALLEGRPAQQQGEDAERVEPLRGRSVAGNGSGSAGVAGMVATAVAIGADAVKSVACGVGRLDVGSSSSTGTMVKKLTHLGHLTLAPTALSGTRTPCLQNMHLARKGIIPSRRAGSSEMGREEAIPDF